MHGKTLSHQQEYIGISPESQDSFPNDIIAIPSHNSKWRSLYLSNLFFPNKHVNAREDVTPMNGSLVIIGDSSLLRCYSNEFGLIIMGDSLLMRCVYSDGW